MLLIILPAWTDGVRLFLECGTFMALIVYVAKTWEMASATREAAKASADAYREAVEARAEALAPRVLLYLSPEVSLLRLVVENAGAGTAEDVRFSFNPPLGTTHPRLKPIFFDSPQALLPPGYKLIHTVDSWPAFLQSDLPKRYEVTITYRGIETRRTYSMSYSLDMESLKHLYVADRKDIHDVATALLALKDSVPRQSLDLTEHFEDWCSDYALISATPTTASLHDQLADLASLWRLFQASSESKPTFVDRKGLARRLRVASVALLLTVGRDGRSEEALKAATEMALAFLDEREAGLLSDEWRSDVERLIALLKAATRSKNP
jgi:hypothetical protein